MTFQRVICPHCQNDDMRMLEWMPIRGAWVCIVCSKTFEVPNDSNGKGKGRIQDSETEI